jgi:hypothetical protein
MEAHVETQSEKKRKRSKGLLIATAIYGVLYAWFVIVSFIPAPEGNWVSSTVPFEPFDLEQIFVKLLFLLFLIGFQVVWKNELAGGVIFLVWWVAMWGMEIFVAAPIKGGDAGGGIGMGLPLFVLGILFVRRWYKGRSVETIPTAP